MSLVASPARRTWPLSLTCNDVSVSVLHSVLVLLSGVPRCRLSFKEALEERGSDTKHDKVNRGILMGGGVLKTWAMVKQAPVTRMRLFYLWNIVFGFC